MNKNNAHLYLPLVQALADGETIQVQAIGFDKWNDCACPLFESFTFEHFRIKPKPIERWYLESAEVYLTKEECESGNWETEKAIKLVQVDD